MANQESKGAPLAKAPLTEDVVCSSALNNKTVPLLDGDIEAFVDFRRGAPTIPVAKPTNSVLDRACAAFGAAWARDHQKRRGAPAKGQVEFQVRSVRPFLAAALAAVSVEPTT